MNLLRSLLYEFQYSKYVRQAPFYLMRHFGKRSYYKTENVDFALGKYSFNARYRPIAYALFCKPEDYQAASRRYLPHPPREFIIEKVSSRYFKNGESITLYTLMKRSMFKSRAGGETGPSASKEYWSLMSKFDDKNS